MGEGDPEGSPGGSGASASEGGVGARTLGGVDEVLREDDEPLRDTQEVSITLTPMLQWDTDAQPITAKEGASLGARGVGGAQSRDQLPPSNHGCFKT